MKRTAVGIGVLVALAVLLAAGMGGVAAQDQPTNTTEQSNASFGATVSSFMQASSADAEGEVDDGMFEASLNRAETAEERRSLIEQRQERLQERQQRLENRRAMLAESGSEVRSRAVAARVTTGANGLEKSINDTEAVAASAGVDTAALEALRNDARNLSGGEVSELARGVGLGAMMRGGERGPPENIGGAESEAENGSNVSIGVPGAGGDGPPADGRNETDGGMGAGGDNSNAGNAASEDASDSESNGRQADSDSTAGTSDDGNAPDESESNGDTDETSRNDG